MKRLKLDGEEIEGEQMNMADNLMLLSRGSGGAEESDGSAESLPGQVFECKTCNRQFTSFQALGGHRASHKKPRLLAHNQGSREGSARKPKVKIHECSICGLEFSIGQALGGT